MPDAPLMKDVSLIFIPPSTHFFLSCVQPRHIAELLCSIRSCQPLVRWSFFCFLATALLLSMLATLDKIQHVRTPYLSRPPMGYPSAGAILLQSVVGSIGSGAAVPITSKQNTLSFVRCHSVKSHDRATGTSAMSKRTSSFASHGIAVALKCIKSESVTVPRKFDRVWSQTKARGAGKVGMESDLKTTLKTWLLDAVACISALLPFLSLSIRSSYVCLCVFYAYLFVLYSVNLTIFVLSMNLHVTYTLSETTANTV